MMKSARILVLLVSVLVIAAAATTGYWFWTANRVRDGLEKWAAKRRSQGYALNWSRETIAGFPLSFRIALADMSIARGNFYHVVVPEIIGVAPAWNLMHWQVAAPRGGSGTAQGFDAPIAAQSALGEVMLGDTVSDVSISVVRVTGGGATAGELIAHVTVPRQVPLSHRDLGLEATCQLYHLVLPKPVTALGDTIESFAFDLAIMGRVPPDDWRRALAAWRDDGGTVELRQADLQWGSLWLEMNGTLALDDDLQPTAAMTASIIDHDALIDAAVAAGTISRKNGILVKLALDLIASHQANGQTRLTAPVTLEGGELSIGRATIGKVPHIEWR
jgi:hypothetical protein